MGVSIYPLLMATLEDTPASADLNYALTIAQSLPFTAISSIALDPGRSCPLEIRVAGRYDDTATRLDVDTIAYHIEGDVEPDQERSENTPWPRIYYAATATGRLSGRPTTLVRSDAEVSRNGLEPLTAADFEHARCIVDLLRMVPNLLPVEVFIPIGGRSTWASQMVARTEAQHARGILRTLRGTGQVNSVESDQTPGTRAYVISALLGNMPFSIAFTHDRTGR
jgi:hypothetical protein